MQIGAHIKGMAFDLRVIACMTGKHHDSLRQQQANRQAPAAAHG